MEPKELREVRRHLGELLGLRTRRNAVRPMPARDLAELLGVRERQLRAYEAGTAAIPPLRARRARALLQVTDPQRIRKALRRAIPRRRTDLPAA